MIICSCHAISDHDVHSAIAQGDSQSLSADRLHGCFGCQLKCGRCVSSIQRILDGEPTCQQPTNWREKRLPQLCFQTKVSIDSACESLDYIRLVRNNQLEMESA